MIKRIILLSVAGFFLAIMAVAYHHHDNAFLLRSCSICKVKTTTSGTTSKSKINSAPAVTIGYLDLAAVFPLLDTVVDEKTTNFISSQIGYIYPNKAPPVRS